MSGAAPEQEPSIEEILASIRQIISDDDAPAPAESAEPEPIPEPEPEPIPEPVFEQPKEEILELKDPLPPPERPTIDLEEVPEPVVAAPLPPPPMPEPQPPSEEPMDDSILSNAAKDAALSGFAKLAGSMSVDRGNTPRVASGGTTLEDIVRDMLTPMLRDWLDSHLPEIIEKLVEKELDKLARKAMDD